MRRPGTDQRGFALVAVLLVLAFVAVIGAEFAYSMRLEATAARVYKETVIATHLAEAGIEQAKRELAAEIGWVGLGDERDPDIDVDCPIAFYGRNRASIRRLPHKNVPLGAGHFTYCISDEQARINLNNPPRADTIPRLLEALGLEREDRDTIWASLQDWRDGNEEHRLNGAESEDTYLKLPQPYRAKNAALDSVAELVQIKGITPKLMNGENGRPGLAEFVTVRGQSQVNVNTARQEVFKALNVSDAQFSRIEQTRRLGPYTSLQGLNIAGLSLTTTTFRIDAQGIVDGQVRARLTAIVQKRPGTGGETLAVLEWSGVR